MSAGDTPRGNSSSARGFPRVSASSCCRTRGSSGPTSDDSRSSRASPSSSPSITSSGSLSRRGSDRRPAKTIPTASASSRLAASARAWTVALSSHCSSSMRQTIGCSVAASDRRFKMARATRNRSGGGAARRPNATFTALRCGGGSRSTPPSNGLRTWWSAAKASSVSASTPAPASTRQPSACVATCSSSADFPIPGSPRSTSTWLCPERTAATKASSRARSARLPTSGLDHLTIEAAVIMESLGRQEYADGTAKS
jgi:hypothetical protein